MTLSLNSAIFAGRGLDKVWAIRKATNVVYKMAARGKDTILRDIQGSKMLLDASDMVLSKTLYFTGVWEKEVTDLLRAITKEGMVLVDVGAHIGYFTLLGARLVGETGEVFAFEPDIKNFSLLDKNVGLNGYENVIRVKKAVTDKVGNASLFLNEDNSGDHSLRPSRGQTSVYIETTSLDRFFYSSSFKPDIVKMDIQGAEMAALRGMDRLIRTNPSLKLIIEFWPAGIRGYGDSPAELLGGLLQYDFDIYRITARGLETTDPVQLLELCEANEGELKFTNIYCERR